MGKRAKRSRAEIAADKRRTGMPPRLGRENQRARVMVNLTDIEHSRLTTLAGAEGLSLSANIIRILKEKGVL